MLAQCKATLEKETPKLECNAACVKHQRQEKLKKAFAEAGNDKKKALKNIKETFEQEYYPDEAIQFAVKDLRFALKVEKILSDIVLTKKTYTFHGISPYRKSFLNTLVFEHFKLDVCAYGKNAKNITDVFWKEGSRIPTMMVTEIASLI